MNKLPIDQNKLNSEDYNEKLEYIIFYLRSTITSTLRDRNEFGFTKLSDKELLREYMKGSTEDNEQLLTLMLKLVSILEGNKIEVSKNYNYIVSHRIGTRNVYLNKFGVYPMYVYEEKSLKRIEYGYKCSTNNFLESLLTELERGFIKGRNVKVLKR